MHQLFLYLITQQQTDRLREADRDRVAHHAARAQQRRLAGERATSGREPDPLSPFDARRVLALTALGIGRVAAAASRLAAAASRLAANTSRAAAGTAQRIDPGLDEAIVRRAIGAAGR